MHISEQIFESNDTKSFKESLNRLILIPLNTFIIDFPKTKYFFEFIYEFPIPNSSSSSSSVPTAAGALTYSTDLTENQATINIFFSNVILFE